MPNDDTRRISRPPAACCAGVIRNTSLVHSAAFPRPPGTMYIKPENMQVTGAYKIRGAYYKISTLTERRRPGAGHRLRGQPRPGRGLRRPGRRREGHHRHAHHHPPGEG